MKKFIKGIKWFAKKFADVWALGLLAVGLYFLEPFIREHYDITTAEMGGSFYTTILYRWVLVVSLKWVWKPSKSGWVDVFKAATKVVVSAYKSLKK